MKSISAIQFRNLYEGFDTPLTGLDCGLKCAPYNPRGIPFCCDLEYTVPVAYQSEWRYLSGRTSLWRPWRGGASAGEKEAFADLQRQIPEHLCLLQCRGARSCVRPYRTLSCRQFPFFPYLNSHARFIGITYDWEFRHQCWVISNLRLVSDIYMKEFIHTFDQLFQTWPEDMQCYADLCAETRAYYQAERRRIPLLHRDGSFCLVSPGSERVQRVTAERLPRFTPYTSAQSTSTPIKTQAMIDD